LAYAERLQLITSLEAARKSRIVSYFLADRETFPPNVPGLATQVGSEAQLLFIDQIRAVGKTKQLDLFLYTRGGNTDAVWPLVRLLRENCEKLTVIVPFRAHSAGTLLCLGADEVIMNDFSELSPIDPTTGNHFNPPDPTNPQNRYGISVEDVTAYQKLAEEIWKIKEEGYRLDVFKQLAQTVHPLALGNIQRVYLQIRQLARNLLTLHMDGKNDGKKIDTIIEALTEKFYSHLHAITRSEAKALLGDWVRPPNAEEAPLIWNLFDSYAQTLELRSRFNVPTFMGDQQVRDLRAIGAYIESSNLSHIHATDMRISQRPNLPPNVQVQVPPGGAIPLVPWVGRTYDWGVQGLGWRVNNEGL